MARLTVEDCLERVHNRYDLVILASKRARQITMGSEPLIDINNDKPTVVALREIAEGLITQENVEKIGKFSTNELETDELGFPLADHLPVSMP